ncbi:MAG TPA: beta-glucuronidase [Sphingomonadaceae bacterium]|nr:beta-glucuronidase [Sphingomonadaceae bacterium]
MNEAPPEGQPLQCKINRRQSLVILGASIVASTASPGMATAEQITRGASATRPSRLYPHESSTRSTEDLSGLWKFQLDPQDRGEATGWINGLPTPRRIPVPCSWNEIFDDARNYFGTAWYETEIAIRPEAAGRRQYLRFGAASYRAKAWLNGRLLGEHLGGHLPFVFDVTDTVRTDGPNRLVVLVENRLTLDRVPAIPDPATAKIHTPHFPQTTYDFFPYGGLHRPVLLFSTPSLHVHDVTVVTSLDRGTGVVDVEFTTNSAWSGAGRVTLDGADRPISAVVNIAQGKCRARLRIPSVRAWGPEDPYLYRLTVVLGDEQPTDEYHLKIGVRTVEVRGDKLLLNGKPVFLRGFGKHEDFALHGRGLNLAAAVRDNELMKSLGANSFRTSHYPYAEEAMMLADEQGLLVIDETPAVSLVFMDAPRVIEARRRELLSSIEELIDRDKNHPSVIMWSVANEPLLVPFQTSNQAPKGAVEAGTSFFKSVFEYTRRADSTRPVVLVSAWGGPDEWVGLGDIICTNVYASWYGQPGQLELAAENVAKEVERLRARHGKPVFFTEFGADAVAGMHAQPAEMFSEEYQAEMIEIYIRTLEKYPYVIGTHPWAFADFRTQQAITRVGALNHKGVFTRDRRPKLAAHKLRELWSADGRGKHP